MPPKGKNQQQASKKTNANGQQFKHLEAQLLHLRNAVTGLTAKVSKDSKSILKRASSAKGRSSVRSTSSARGTRERGDDFVPGRVYQQPSSLRGLAPQHHHHAIRHAVANIAGLSSASPHPVVNPSAEIGARNLTFNKFNRHTNIVTPGCTKVFLINPFFKHVLYTLEQAAPSNGAGIWLNSGVGFGNALTGTWAGMTGAVDNVTFTGRPCVGENAIPSVGTTDFHEFAQFTGGGVTFEIELPHDGTGTAYMMSLDSDPQYFGRGACSSGVSGDAVIPLKPSFSSQWTTDVLAIGTGFSSVQNNVKSIPLRGTAPKKVIHAACGGLPNWFPVATTSGTSSAESFLYGVVSAAEFARSCTAVLVVTSPVASEDITVSVVSNMHYAITIAPDHPLRGFVQPSPLGESHEPASAHGGSHGVGETLRDALGDMMQKAVSHASSFGATDHSTTGAALLASVVAPTSSGPTQRIGPVQTALSEARNIIGDVGAVEQKIEAAAKSGRFKKAAGFVGGLFKKAAPVAEFALPLLL